jgi:hypothetical protein
MDLIRYEQLFLTNRTADMIQCIFAFSIKSNDDLNEKDKIIISYESCRSYFDYSLPPLHLSSWLVTSNPLDQRLPLQIHLVSILRSADFFHTSSDSLSVVKVITALLATSHLASSSLFPPLHLCYITLHLSLLMSAWIYALEDAQSLYIQLKISHRFLPFSDGYWLVFFTIFFIFIFDLFCAMISLVFFYEWKINQNLNCT